MTVPAHEFIGKIDEEGRLPEYTRKAVGVVLRGYKGKVVKVTIKPQALRRSSKQNSYYWSVVVIHWKAIFADYGTIATDDEVHAYLVAEVGKLFKPVLDPHGNPIYRDDGRPVYELRSTSELSTKEFTDFLEACRAEAATEHAHDIPPPQPQEN